jgi:hypothetical protein
MEQLQLHNAVAALGQAMGDAWSTASEYDAHLCSSAGEPEVYESRLLQQSTSPSILTNLETLIHWRAAPRTSGEHAVADERRSGGLQGGASKVGEHPTRRGTAAGCDLLGGLEDVVVDVQRGPHFRSIAHQTSDVKADDLRGQARAQESAHTVRLASACGQPAPLRKYGSASRGSLGQFWLRARPPAGSSSRDRCLAGDHRRRRGS